MSGKRAFSWSALLAGSLRYAEVTVAAGIVLFNDDGIEVTSIEANINNKSKTL